MLVRRARAVSAAAVMGILGLLFVVAPAHAQIDEADDRAGASDATVDQGPGRRAAVSAADFDGLANRLVAPVLHVKLVDGATGGDLDAVLVEPRVQAAGVSLTPLFANAQAPADQREVDLTRWWRLDLALPYRAGPALRILNADPVVEVALAAPDVASASLAQATPDFEPNQTHRDPAPDGVDADYAATIAGGTGSGVVLTDVEYSWNTAHEDLTDTVGTEIANGTPADPFEGVVTCPTCHGTAVLGVIAAEANGFGVTGIAPDADIQLVNTFTADTGQELAAAIDLAAANSDAGDVILIEQQLCPVPIIGGNCLPGWLPVEWFPSYYDAIVAAVDEDVHVVQAGGNGGRNVDTELVFPDSGSIIVGAGNAPGCNAFFPVAPPNGRLWFSNHGERIDLQAHGACVWTTGSEGGGTNPDDSRSYTSGFTGTSSAAAIVAGAVTSLAGVAAADGTSLDPAQLRALLRATGTPQDTTLDGEPIGPLPNLRVAIDLLLAGPLVAPDNDDLTQAAALTPPVTVQQATARATVEPGEPVASCGFPDTTVWFEVSPTRHVDVRFVVTAERADPSLAVWRSIDGDLLAEEACRTSADSGAPAHLRLLAGETYLVQVGNTGGSAITLELGAGPECDIDGDGVGDVLVGVPGESINGAAEAGAVTVVYGDRALFAGADLDAPLLHADRPDVAGTVAPGDRFGSSLACGDIDGDGYDDAVIGIDGRDWRTRPDAGAVLVVPGGPTGLDPTRDRLVTQATGGVPGHPERGDRFGSGVAVGDVNGDGYDDVVIAAVGEGIARRPRAGWVVVLDGGPGGLDTSRGRVLHQNVAGIPGRAERGDGFGASLAVADLNGDGFAEVVVGAPDEGIRGQAGVGLVTVVDGSPVGADPATAQWYRPTQPWIGVDPAAGTRFGAGLAVADGNQDGSPDLFVTAPGAADGASALVAVVGGAGGLTRVATVDVGSASAGGLGYGPAIAAGDIDGDDTPELVVGTPAGLPGGDQALVDAGLAQLLGVADASLGLLRVATLHQETPGLRGTAAAGDRFGHVVLVRDLDDDGFADLVVGVPGDRVFGAQRAGVIAVVPGSGAGLDLRADLRISQRTPGVGGGREIDDGFGWTLG